MAIFNPLLPLALLSLLAGPAAARPSASQDSTPKPCGATSAKCVPYIKSYSGPLLDNFTLGDPSTLKISNSEYFVYATQQGDTNVPYATTKQGLQSGWAGASEDALPRKQGYGTGKWSENPLGNSHVWSPDVSKLNATTYIMYYSAVRAKQPGEDPSHITRCIGVAYSTKPEGPFKALDETFSCGPGDNNIAIGVDGFVDNSTPPKRYVLYKYGSYPNGGGLSHVGLQQVDPSDGMTKIGDIHLLTTQQQGKDAEESPALALMPNGKWTLLHTEGIFNKNYVMVYATSNTKDVTKDYEDLHLGATLMTDGDNGGTGPAVYTPGGPDFLGNSYHFIFAATGTKNGTQRHIYSAELGYKEVS